MIDYAEFSSGNLLEDEVVRTVIEQSFLYLTVHPVDAEAFAFGDTSWRIKIVPNLAKSAIVAAVMVGLLHATGCTHLASLVLPAVLPSLIDIETIRLTVKDDLILAEMRRNDGLRGKAFCPQEIYDQLSPSTREQFSFIEFVEVLDALSISGNMDWDQNTGLFTLNKNRKLRIIFS
ncbi:MAG: hypothetical protein JZU65_09480 [Chlorobium sp.]|nr:hypothetical protein [Chlorobium sp.]